MTMSRVPYSPNKLSPWPRVLFRNENDDADAGDGVEAEPNDSVGSGENNKHPTLPPRTKRGSLSNVRFANSNLTWRGRRTSFGSTQQQLALVDYPSVKLLDREKSGREVQRLLKLRTIKLKEAKQEGNNSEVYRLKHLNLFEDIEKPEIEADGLVADDSEAVYEIASPATTQNGSFSPRSPSTSHDHAQDLCWYMKLQQAYGAAIPGEFSCCAIHPGPEQATIPSSWSDSTLTQSPKSFKSSTKISPLHETRAVFHEFSTNDTSVAGAPANESSTGSKADEEDPFLYIAKYILGRSEVIQGRIAKYPATSSCRTEHDRGKATAHCTCPSHDCRRYLSGTPSHHCHNCRLPKPQPEIQAAMERIDGLKTSAMSSDDARISMPERNSQNELSQYGNLQEDLKLVELYNADMEKRCSKGVWWEGWLIVRDLKSQGIVGSESHVYENTDLWS